ncbi:hypothetical protein EDB89DRAFT_1903731 [Lactarius sanguifluus]|nr:hypothetical protein EDB89DRAFT_1903731 [Lactarius sanguifluus]
MANEWSSPHARNHVSSAVVGQDPAILLNIPSVQYGVNAVTEPCACAECTGHTPNRPPTWYTADRQDWDSRPSGDTYINQGQGISAPTGAPLTAPVLAQMHFAAPGVQEQANPALSQATAGTPQTLAVVQPHQNPAIGISAAEGLRRLADRYINNPASLVSVSMETYMAHPEAEGPACSTSPLRLPLDSPPRPHAVPLTRRNLMRLMQTMGHEVEGLVRRHWTGGNLNSGGDHWQVGAAKDEYSADFELAD